VYRSVSYSTRSQTPGGIKRPRYAARIRSTAHPEASKQPAATLCTVRNDHECDLWRTSAPLARSTGIAIARGLLRFATVASAIPRGAIPRRFRVPADRRVPPPFPPHVASPRRSWNLRSIRTCANRARRRLLATISDASSGKR